jgi:hypothetical protein
MHVYKRSIILLLSSLVFFHCSAQKSKVDLGESTATANSDSVETKIIIARNEYHRITADSSKFRIVTENLEGQSTEGGEIKKYYEGESLRIAQVTFYGEMGKSVTDYYFLNKELFFSFHRIYHYNVPIYMKGSTINKVEEERFYFSKLRLIRWIGFNGKIVHENLYPAKEKEIVKSLTENVFKK